MLAQIEKNLEENPKPAAKPLQKKKPQEKLVESKPQLAKVISDQLAPIASRIDEEGIYPKQILHRIGLAGAYGHHVNGSATGLVRAVQAMSDIGEACMSTAFCTWCQDALVWYLSNADYKTDNLTKRVANGKQLGGTGLSNPMKAFSNIESIALKGRQVKGGYRITGTLPWVSNIDPSHVFAAVFVLSTGRKVMALIDCDETSVTLGNHAHFIALEGTATRSVAVRDLFISEEQVIAEDASEFIPRIRQGFVLLQFGMALGVAKGIANLMIKDKAGRKSGAWLPLQGEAILERTEALSESVVELAEHNQDTSRKAFLQVLSGRLQASWLALDAAQAGMLQFGSRGYLYGSEISRRAREAQFVGIVTPSVKHITMELAREK